MKRKSITQNKSAKQKLENTQNNKGNPSKHLIIGSERCVCCGEIIPEGSMVCAKCESRTSADLCIICGQELGDRGTICPSCAAAIQRKKE